MEFILTQRAIVWPAERLLETGDLASVWPPPPFLTMEAVVWLQLTGPSPGQLADRIFYLKARREAKSSF